MTARQRIADSIEKLCERLNSTDHPDQLVKYTEAIDDLSRALERLPEVSSDAPGTTSDAGIKGRFGDWRWELGHGSETVVLTLRGAYGSAVLATQAPPADVFELAEALAAQARYCLEHSE